MHGLENQAIEIVAQALCTDVPSAFESRSAVEIVGYGMSKNCADKVFRKAGFREGEGRDQVGVVELHDCFAANEVCLFYFHSQDGRLSVVPAYNVRGAGLVWPWRSSQNGRERR